MHHLTPRQYHEEKLKTMAKDSGSTLAEVRDYYGTDVARELDFGEWASLVIQAAQAGEKLRRTVLDKLLEIRPHVTLPETALPPGYQRPSARRKESIEAKARRYDRRALKSHIKQTRS